MSLRRARWVTGGLVALALASSVAVVLTSRSVTTSERLARQNNVFRSWRPAELRRVRVASLESPTESPILLTRIAESTDPHDFALGAEEPRKADPGAVAELLGALEFATWLRRIEPAEVDRQSFGLQDPELEVEVTFRGVDYRLVIGGEAPSPQGGRYAELTGTGVPEPGVGVVAAEFVAQLRVDVRAFLGRQLLPYAKSEIARIELEGEGGERTLVRDPRGWRVGNADGPRAAAEVVDGMFFQMARVTASRYVDLEGAREALGERSVQLTQVPSEGAPVRVRLGGSCPEASDEIIALRETDPVVAGCVPATVLPALLTSAEELIDRSPFPFRPDEIDHFTLVEGDAVVEAVRSGARFDLVRPRRSELELDAGNDFLQALVSPQGELHREAVGSGKAVDRKALGLAPPRGSATVRGLVEGTDEAVDLTVDYGPPDASGRVWLERKDDGVLLALPRQRAAAFSTDDTWTRSRSVLHVEENQIERVLVRSGGATYVVERAPDGGLRLARPEGFELDGGLASDWLSALHDLRAVRWLPRGPAADRAAPERAGPDREGLEVDVTYTEGDERRRLRFSAGARTVGGHLATLDEEGRRSTFVLPSATFRTLTTLPISRLTMSPDVDHLERIVVEAQGLTATLERRAGELVSADGLLTPDGASALEQALRALHPLAAVHVGPPQASDGLARPALVLSGRTRRLGREPETFRFVFGRVGTWQGRTVQFARADGVEATFAFDHDQIQALLDLL